MISQLAVKKTQLESEVGDNLGFGMGPLGGDPEWSTRDAIRIRSAVQSGLRTFYFSGHAWSFMRQTKELLLPEGATTVALPQDFGGVDGQTRMLVKDSSGQGRMVLDFEGIGTVNMALQVSPTLTGWPRRIAQRPTKNGRDELVVAPIADQDYTLTFEYQVTPDYVVSELQPYVYGGVEHHEAILALCLASSELNNDNQLGPYSAKAQELLQRAIKMDRMKQPQKLGPNRDRSDNVDVRQHWFDRQWPTTHGGVMVDGVLYDE